MAIDCEDAYQDPEEVLKEILCQVVNLANGSNIVEIETALINRKFCLVSDPTKNASVEIVRNEDGTFNSYKIHVLDGTGTITTQQDLSGLTICEEDLGPILQSMLTSLQNIEGLVDQVEPLLTNLEALLNSNNQDNQTIIAGISAIVGEVQNVVTALVAEGDQTQALITQGNTIAQAVLDYLNNNSCTNPFSVTVCNQVNLANIEASLSSMVSLLTDIRTSVQSIETETNSQTLLLTDQINRLDSIITLIQSGNTTLAQIQAEVNNVNQNLVIVTNFLDAIELDTTAILAQVTDTNIELQNTQTLLQNEFDQTQALLSVANSLQQNIVNGISDLQIKASDANIKADERKVVLDNILLELQKVSREYEILQVGGMLLIDTSVKSFADVVDNLNLATPNAIAVPTDAVGFKAMVKGDPIFVTDNGLNPNGTGTFKVGECYEEGDFIFGGQEPRFDNQCFSDLSNMKFISEGTSYLQISYYKLK